MSAWTYRAVLTGAAASFVGGWAAGLFLGLWAYATLGL